MNIKTWHVGASAVVATASIAALLGWKSPAASAAAATQEISAVKVEVEKVKERVNNHDVDIAGMKKDIDYAARGIEALLDEKGLTPRPRRRSVQ